MEEQASNTSNSETFAAILERRLSRRTLIRGAAGGAAALALTVAVAPLAHSRAAVREITLSPIKLSNRDQIEVATGLPGLAAHCVGRPTGAGLYPD